ncbi:hypothetical protein RUM43_006885 [Polyplax serrata]|uniref:Uncharacterized protein n=1 Tax=Polyplax serrata TaxID=468196 RepID=A0AAN8PLL9_POLSC
MDRIRKHDKENMQAERGEFKFDFICHEVVVEQGKARSEKRKSDSDKRKTTEKEKKKEFSPRPEKEKE